MSERLPLDTLIDLARESTDEAARALGLLQVERSNAQQQLTMLEDYRHDYLVRMQSAMQTGMSAADCHNYHRFIATLDDAIAQQNGVLRQVDEHLVHGRQKWQHEKRRLNAFDTLAQRQQQARQVAANRREQRLSDEYAARLARRAHAAY